MGICRHQGNSSLMVHLSWKQLIILGFFSSLLLFQIFWCVRLKSGFVLFHRWLFARVFLIPQEPRRPKRVDGEKNQSEPVWKPRKKTMCQSVFFLRPAASLSADRLTPAAHVSGCFIPQPSRATFPWTFYIQSASQSSSVPNDEVILVLRLAVGSRLRVSVAAPTGSGCKDDISTLLHTRPKYQDTWATTCIKLQPNCTICCCMQP